MARPKRPREPPKPVVSLRFKPGYDDNLKKNRKPTKFFDERHREISQQLWQPTPDNIARCADPRKRPDYQWYTFNYWSTLQDLPADYEVGDVPPSFKRARPSGMSHRKEIPKGHVVRTHRQRVYFSSPQVKACFARKDHDVRYVKNLCIQLFNAGAVSTDSITTMRDDLREALVYLKEREPDVQIDPEENDVLRFFVQEGIYDKEEKAQHVSETKKAMRRERGPGVKRSTIDRGKLAWLKHTESEILESAVSDFCKVVEENERRLALGTIGSYTLHYYKRKDEVKKKRSLVLQQQYWRDSGEVYPRRFRGPVFVARRPKNRKKKGWMRQQRSKKRSGLILPVTRPTLEQRGLKPTDPSIHVSPKNPLDIQTTPQGVMDVALLPEELWKKEPQKKELQKKELRKAEPDWKGVEAPVTENRLQKLGLGDKDRAKTEEVAEKRRLKWAVDLLERNAQRLHPDEREEPTEAEKQKLAEKKAKEEARAKKREERQAREDQELNEQQTKKAKMWEDWKRQHDYEAYDRRREAQQSKKERCRHGPHRRNPHKHPLPEVPGRDDMDGAARLVIQDKGALGEEHWLHYAKYKKIQAKTAASPTSVVAIDPGVLTFATGYSNDGTVFEAGTAEDQKRIRNLCLSADYLASRVTQELNHRRRRSMKKALQRMKDKVKNLVTDMHWKLANHLCRNYSLILLPKFSPSSMCRKTRRLLSSSGVRSMLNWSHCKFRERLLSKAEEYEHCTVLLVREDYTTKTCSRCGTLNPHMTLGDRTFRCVDDDCGFVAGRDWNAAKNIMLRHLSWKHLIEEEEEEEDPVAYFTAGSCLDYNMNTSLAVLQR